ncbi:MAG: hypothetical protein HFG26_11490 [Provencibacterium sp.]|nr:hypothetical protein [Provencibacterium sp.]
MPIEKEQPATIRKEPPVLRVWQAAFFAGGIYEKFKIQRRRYKKRTENNAVILDNQPNNRIIEEQRKE